MALAGTEIKILNIFRKLKEAIPSLISRKLLITIGYADYLCRYLASEDYLELTGKDTYTYKLTLKGKRILAGQSVNSLLDQKTVKAIAGEIAKELGDKLDLSTGERVKPIKKEEIKIKETFVFPFEEKPQLEHNLDQNLQEKCFSSKNVDQTIDILKKFKK